VPSAYKRVQHRSTNTQSSTVLQRQLGIGVKIPCTFPQHTTQPNAANWITPAAACLCLLRSGLQKHLKSGLYALTSSAPVALDLAEIVNLPLRQCVWSPISALAPHTISCLLLFISNRGHNLHQVAHWLMPTENSLRIDIPLLLASLL
jgi:hypothetical protein